MATPLQSRKQSVDLAATNVRVSRIRRDPPPPPPKEVSAADIRERETLNILVGVAVIALSLFVILVGLGKFGGWSPSQYTVRLGEP